MKQLKSTLMILMMSAAAGCASVSVNDTFCDLVTEPPLDEQSIDGMTEPMIVWLDELLIKYDTTCKDK